MKFKFDNGPHMKNEDNTNKMMLRVLIALIPIVCFTIFKNVFVVYNTTDAKILELIHPILIIISSILTSLLSEYLYIRFIKKDKISFKNLSKSFAIIPGLLLALCLPLNTPIHIVVFGSFCATTIGKMIFGGFGQNIFNPALIGYLLISASYSSKLGNYLNLYELDTIGGSTPLTNLANLNYYGSYDTIVGKYGSLLNFFTGTIPGGLGEVSKVLILIAFIYLVLTKTIKWRIPVTYVGTVFFMTLIIGNATNYGLWYPTFHILSGGLLFGAVFMATDPVTSPITKVGQLLYGICLGILTVLLRFLTPYPEGVMTSILFMNMFTTLFDKIGLKVKYNFEKIFIPIAILIFILLMSVIKISSNVRNTFKEGNKELENVKILDTKKENNQTKYTISSKGWGLIKAEVIVEDKNIKSIVIIDSSGETQWSEIENANYIYKIISNQNDIDNLDAVSGSTKTSNGLKNIVKKVNEEIKNEK